jgi:hypothetical protein
VLCSPDNFFTGTGVMCQKHKDFGPLDSILASVTSRDTGNNHPRRDHAW